MDGVPELKFAAARGAQIGYQDDGDGDTTIVAIPPAVMDHAGVEPHISSPSPKAGR